MSKNKSVRNLVILFSAIALVAGGGFAVLALWLSSPGVSTVEYHPGQTETPNAQVDIPVQSLNGTWTADSGDGAIMTATVQNNTIEILMENEGVSMIYWMGTFVDSADDGEVVKSDKIEVDKAVMSQAISKDFIVGDGVMSFELKAMGMTRMVVLNHAT